MKPAKLRFALAAALLAMPFVSFAQDAAAANEEEASSPWEISLVATTDYVFRGVSQTNNGPAFQPSVTYSAPFGLYAGVWASNVDFGNGDEPGVRGPNFEVDYFVGWNKDLSDSWNIDLGVQRYTYEGASAGYGSIDYNEYLATLTWSGPVEVSGLLGYADNYSNLDAEQTYAALAAGYEIGDSGVSLGASVGYTTIKYGEGTDDYFDGSVSVSKSFGPATATLGYYDTFGSDADWLRADSDIYKPGLVLSVSVDLP